MSVTGRVVGEEGAPARPGGKVQLVLRSLEAQTAMGLLGVAVIGQEGLWEANIALPTHWPPGTYDLRAEFLGDRRLAPSVSP